MMAACKPCHARGSVQAEHPRQGTSFCKEEAWRFFVYCFVREFGFLISSVVDMAHGAYPGVEWLQDRCLD